MLRIGLAVATALSAGVARGADAPHAATLFGGVMLDNVWEQVFLEPHRLNVEGGQFVGGALSARVAQPAPGLSLEIEGQLVRHFGGQSHWEINAPLAVARWGRFPWSERVPSSAAFGIGPSFAAETPALEARNEGESRPTMVYWMMEVEVGAPDADWRLVGRLHHRSTAYGLFGDDGGSNALALGVRRRF